MRCNIEDEFTVNVPLLEEPQVINTAWGITRVDDYHKWAVIPSFRPRGRNNLWQTSY